MKIFNWILIWKIMMKLMINQKKLINLFNMNHSLFKEINEESYEIILHHKY